MSGAAAGDAATKQATVSDNKDTSKPLQQNKPAAQLEEDDEFEDFPVEGTMDPSLSIHREDSSTRRSCVSTRDGAPAFEEEHKRLSTRCVYEVKLTILGSKQTGTKKRRSEHRQVVTRIFGRRAGTMMIPQMSSVYS